MSMRLVMSIVGWLIPFFVFVLFIFTDLIGVDFFLRFNVFWFLYFIIARAANTDREAEVTDTMLPRWLRIALFFNQPNPFRKKTVICQIVHITITAISVIIWSIIPQNKVSNITTIAYVFVLVVLINICDIRMRRKYKDTSFWK